MGNQMKHARTFFTEAGRSTLFLLRYVAFWLLYFLICRAVFVLYHGAQIKLLPAETIFGIFSHALRMDISSAAYLVIIPFMLWFINSLVPAKLTKKLITGYTVFMLLLVALIATSDLEVYKIWGTKLNAQAIGYLKYPKEAMASMSSSPVYLLIAICAGIFLAGCFLYGAVFKRFSFDLPSRSTAVVVSRLILFVVLSGILALVIRGGTGTAPMNPAFAYFSNHQIANHAALNPSWYLMYDVKHSRRKGQVRLEYMPAEEMKERLARVTAGSNRNDTELILKTDRPNIICLILESWTADVIPSLGGIGGLTPNFEELVANGLLFTNILSSGDRTYHGIPSVLSGYPSPPDSSIMTNPHKMEKLPVLSRDLSRAGYGTSFYYGGDDHFDNMRAFFMHGGFNRITNKSSFSKDQMDSKWGAHDHVLYEKVLADLRSSKEPFFVSALTLSSHEPYEVPMNTAVPGSDEASRFKNSMVYADKSLGDFFKKASKERWFKNTLFILIADHGHRLPAGRKASDPEKFRIPLLIYGEVLQDRYKGTKKQMIGSQTDLAATLLSQLNLKHDTYEWSNNLLNVNRNNYAYYTFKNGFGWSNEVQALSFDNVSKKIIFNSKPLLPKETTYGTLRDSQAYLQFLSAKYTGF